MFVDRAIGGEAEAIADLAVSGRDTVLRLELADELEDVALSFGQILHFSLVPDNMGGKEAKVKRELSGKVVG